LCVYLFKLIKPVNLTRIFYSVYPPHFYNTSDILARKYVSQEHTLETVWHCIGQV
jgi:hypothetical protein